MKQKLLSCVMAACLLFPVLTSLAMILYPGGTHSNPDTKGYRFFENFLLARSGIEWFALFDPEAA